MQRKVVVLRHWLQLSVAETREGARHRRGHRQEPLVTGLAALERALSATPQG